MTFDEAVSYANETGWYIYNLHQNFEDHGFEPLGWRCCLRQSTGGYRREISRGKGYDPYNAIMDALSNAPELEAEVKISNLKEDTKAIGTSGAALLHKLGLVEQITRRV